MIGQLDRTNREATVIGAGIAGMLAAYFLDQKGYSVTLLEEKSRAGGLLSTTRTRYGIAESAANSLLASPSVLNLCEQLGVGLTSVRKDSRSRFILRSGKLRKFPLTIGESAGTLRRAALNRSSNHASSLDLETWGARHLGEAAVSYLLAPFVRGIYGIQPSEVGVLAAFPKLLVKPGSTLLGTMFSRKLQRKAKSKRAPMVAPQFGMNDLVARLETHLVRRLGKRFRCGERISTLPEGANVVLATPAYVAAELLKKETPILAELLSAVQYTPLVSVTAFLEKSGFPRPVKGVGVLIPNGEKRNSLGILFSSSSFEGRVTDESRYACFTMMLGGSQAPYWISASDEAIKTTVQQEFSEVLGLRGQILELVINRWPRAIPKYSVDLPHLWQTARETWCERPGRLLFGNYTGQVSLRGMIESASSI